MRTEALLCALVFCVLGCDVPEPIQPGQTYIIGTEGAWTDPELHELAEACVEWGAWTAHRLSCRLAEPGEDSDGVFSRGSTGNAYTNRLDARNRTLILDADSLYERGFDMRSLRGQAENLIAKAALMRTHNATEGVLSRQMVTPELLADDRRSCFTAGFCD